MPQTVRVTAEHARQSRTAAGVGCGVLGVGGSEPGEPVRDPSSLCGGYPERPVRGNAPPWPMHPRSTLPMPRARKRRAMPTGQPRCGNECPPLGGIATPRAKTTPTPTPLHKSSAHRGQAASPEALHRRTTKFTRRRDARKGADCRQNKRRTKRVAGRVECLDTHHVPLGDGPSLSQCCPDEVGRSRIAQVGGSFSRVRSATAIRA
jgi:hypothetical protein